MSGARPSASDVDVDLGRLFGSLLRNWLRIVVVALCVTAIAYMLASMATPKYRAETRILIETRESVFTRPQGTGENERPILDEEGVTSQVEVISSADILRDVARKLNLAEREEFSGGQMSTVGRLMVLLGLKSDPSQASVEERVLKALREDLNVYRVERSRVIVVGFSSADRELAAAVPNAVADAYIAVQEEAKRLSNSDATEWLEPEIADLGQRVKDAEAKVADFRAKSDLLVGQNNTVLATQQLAELSSELTRVRAGRTAAEAKAAAIRDALASGTSIDTLPEVMASAMVQRLRERQLQIEADIADLSTSLLSNHPRIRALNSQRGEVSGQIRRETQKVLAGLETEAESAKASEARILGELDVLKAASARAGEEEVELRALEREAAAQRALLESYLTRYREAASRSDRNYLPADARVFSRATAPFEPYFPKVLPMSAAAFVGALLVMAVITLLRELFSGRAMRPAAGAEFLMVEEVRMPAVAAQAEPAAATEPVSPEPEAMAEIEEPAEEDDAAAFQPEAIDFQEEEVGSAGAPHAGLTVEAAAERLISGGTARAVFISPEGDEATAASVMVAREVADAGLRVLFLDLTYSGAASASMLESSYYPGITNLLASEAQFADIIRGDLYSDCHVIPVGTADPAVAMRAIDRLPIIMSSLTTAYDVVVVECGPTDAEGIGRVVGEGTEVLVSYIEPDEETIANLTANLAAGGYADILMVTPVGHTPPPAPEGRSAA
ncbi:Wzz/FepE/Etk N-terminal domain-containing protein [Aquamicrobium sp. LC103]|uniref:GumC family protein n=1 Tax=Aquamicrobium sp. LC103 TaxID=1120658 RepID=UPI00063ECFFC|nr:Wzz/FepE/Etk N-terminal domain-containing protein [Aquamicrobium sp. LC103]TKT81437.1 chain-length determining protein [Aquamicrobium sp. LC103]